MNEEIKDTGVTDQMFDLVAELLSKADECNRKGENSKNCCLDFCGDHSMPIRVDDLQLLYIGCRLLPNIANYLVNIIPQFFYPYVVAYLQDLSAMREDPVTITELYDIVKSLENGNIHKCSETED